MSLESHSGGLFIVVNSRKRDRSLSCEREKSLEESLLSTPVTPPAMETGKRRFDEDDWDNRVIRGWGDLNVCPEIQEPKDKRSCIRPWSHDECGLFLVQKDYNSTSNFPADYFSETNLPFAESLVELSAGQSYTVGTQYSELLTSSREELEDIVNAATLKSLPVVTRPFAGDKLGAIVQQLSTRELQSGDPEDEGSTNLRNCDKKHDGSRRSEEEGSVGSSPGSSP